MKSFSAATTQDMKSYIQPMINNAPDRIFLHIGTNDLKSKTLNDVANAIVDLAKAIQSTCGAKVVLYELTMRKDAHKESVKSVNKLFIKYRYSKQYHWSLVHHSNITERVLNRGGLHNYTLTKQGNELLYKNSLISIMTLQIKSMLDLQRSTINNQIPSKRGLKLASLNVNKLSMHINEIRIVLADKCLDVLAIQETKLDVSNNNFDFYICGGGICFYIK